MREMRKITTSELRKIVEEHKKGEKANLSHADLRRVIGLNIEFLSSVTTLMSDN